MSRRTRANAERVLVESKTDKGATIRYAVYVPQPSTHAYAHAPFYYGDAGTDPNRPGAKLIQCKSRRLSRAKREVKYMHGVRLYRKVLDQYITAI